MPIQVLLVALPLVAWGLERLVESAQPRLMLAGSVASVAQYLLSLHLYTPDVVVLDLDSVDCIESLADLHRQTKAKILVVTGSSDVALHDSAVLAGARGVVDKRESASASTLLKAIEKVHEGELWIDRNATSRIFLELARKKAERDMDPEQEKIAKLTRREQQTIASLASDPSAPGKLVAERLHISEHTLRNHLTSIYSKLGLTNRVDLYAYALKHGLSTGD
ncbi:LuxR C-terminal-related transcriptional regulator [Pseudomonas baetica]|uniref:LuxR C-terminal-related transcriptional regulator n=1 Tax=Pseudomonas baetica TaxID=674054 RepID=UPI002405F879|nr:response regulator transcription factor [Pseudomonas baetica]MDF9773823.1 DNA-binding NarL/FixJ family response regulator [Pseudomonas baetica]